MIAARGECGLPAVIQTPPRLADGSPFPTLWYLTCRTLTAAVSTLESEGRMASLSSDLRCDPELADAYRVAHTRYIRARRQLGTVPELAGVSAGGMPDRVKCLHALLAHSLAVGAGVNPLGDVVLAELRERGCWPCAEQCVSDHP